MCALHIRRTVSTLLQVVKTYGRQPQTQRQQKASYLSAVCTELGKPLHIQENPSDVPPGPHQVRVSVQAAGIAYADILTCKGMYQAAQKPPFVPGFELSGQVTAVGAKVTSIHEGDRVGVMLNQNKGGAFTQCCYVDVLGDQADYIWKLPDSLSYEEAATLLINYATAIMSLEKARLQEGETVLVTGAAGGTGIAAVELAANVFKAKVIGACGPGDGKSELIQGKGASHVIGYNVREDLKKITQGKGVDVVYDTVGGDMFLDCLKSLAHEGRILTIGFTSGKIPNIPANLLLLKSASAIGVYWGDYKNRKIEDFIKSIDNCILHASNGNIHPVVGEQLPLSQVNEAMEMILKRKTKGKVVLKPQEQ